MNKKQLPEGWRMVKFGEIAKHISKRVEPGKTDLEIYVGLEHLDPDSLRIKRHGVPSDVAGQKLLVQKGQIIFGKRRAYQRKLGIADWNCICSAHAMVLEANPETVLPDFLPFFMQSDVFMDRAVAISEGSLSPTIKWKKLAGQEFSLPPKIEQYKLLKLFKKSRNTFELALDNLDSAKIHRRVMRRILFESHIKKYGCIVIEDFCTKITDGTHDTPQTKETGIPLVTSKNLVDGTISLNDIYCISEKDAKEINRRSKVDVGDVLFAMIGKIGSPVVVNETHGDFCIKNIALFKLNGNIEKATWLSNYLDSSIFDKEILKNQSGNAQKFLPLNFLRKIKIPFFNSDSHSLVEAINHMNDVVYECEKRVSLIQLLTKSLYKNCL